MILTSKQEQGLRIAVERYKNHEPYTVIAGYAGSGKAQPIDTKIPTPDGWKQLGDVQVGDFVYGRTGHPTRVLGVFPQGLKKVFKVKLKDRRETLCAEDHLWTIIDKKNHKQTLTTKQLMQNGLKNSAGYKYALPNHSPIEYPEQNYDIDPYVIGAFLGDGCCKQRQLMISSENEEIPNIIKTLIGAKSADKCSDYNYNWTFSLQEPIIIPEHISYSIYKFQTEKFFQNYQKEICCGAQDKCVPEIYKRGSIQQRLDLLQGLMDTDGSICSNDENRFNVRFTSISHQLILDVKEILLSLGYESTISQDKRSSKYTTGICYDLHINIPNEEKFKLFRLQRKKDVALRAKNFHKQRDYTKIAITEIIEEPYEKEMVCIYVDNPEHLYLTNDFIVTHNTTLVKFIIDALGVPREDVAYVAYTGRASEVLRKKGCPNATTAHKLLYRSKQKADGKFSFYPRKILEHPYKIIVVDEISMLPKPMWDLLLRHRTYVLALGDPF